MKNRFWKKAREKGSEEARLEQDLEERGIHFSKDGFAYFKVGNSVYYMEIQKFYKVKEKMEANHPEWKDLTEPERNLKVFPHLTWHARKVDELEEKSFLKVTEVWRGNFVTAWKIEDTRPVDPSEAYDPLGLTGRPLYPKRRVRSIKPIEEKKEDILTKMARRIFRKFGWRI